MDKKEKISFDLFKFFIIGVLLVLIALVALMCIDATARLLFTPREVVRFEVYKIDGAIAEGLNRTNVGIPGTSLRCSLAEYRGGFFYCNLDNISEAKNE